MNQAIEAGISGFASIIGLAIIFVIGWFAYKAFNFLFDSSKPEPRPTAEPEPKRTTGIVEGPFSKDPDTPIDGSEGSSVEQARDTARQHPKNANVTAAIALAGVGLDQKQVQLIADPTISENIHEFSAYGAFGEMRVTLAGRPLAENP
ncbi:MAG: DUF108 domain-containing protein [Betaproteobacteria bacterium]|nr:DUF108 domain-containing protein [Betaproteobacteria bacterium]